MSAFATEAQRNYISSLLKARLSTLGMSTIDEAARAINLDHITKDDASTLIGRLKSMPEDADPAMPELVAKSTRRGTGNRPGRCASCGHTVEQDAGYYYLDNTARWAVHHREGACDTTPAPEPIQLAVGFYRCGDQVVQVYKTKNQRLAGKVMGVRGGFSYQSGATRLVEANGVPMTTEEVANEECMRRYGAPLGSEALAKMAAKFGAEHGNCMFCDKDLTDERSNPALGGAGYGRHCAKKYGLPWG